MKKIFGLLILCPLVIGLKAKIPQTKPAPENRFFIDAQYPDLPLTPVSARF